MLVLFFDDFKADPRRFLERCFQFIGVDSSFVPEGLRQSRNASETHQSDAPVLKALRRLPTFSTAVRVLPEHWRAAIRRRWFTRGACERPAWSEDLRRKVLWQISDDVRTFLYFYGKPLDYWDLGESDTRDLGESDTRDLSESDTAESFSVASQPALPIRSPLGFLPLPQSPDAMSLG